MFRLSALLLLLIYIPILNATIIDEGLIHNWAGDNNANDSIGGLNGTLTGNTNYDGGIFSSAFLFDGSGDSVILPNISGFGSFTMSAWFNTNQVNIQSQYIFQTGMGFMGLSGSGSGVYFNTFRNRQGFSPSQHTYHKTFNTTIDTNQWYHVALTTTADNSQTGAYLNGELLGSLNFSYSGLGANHNFSRIGVNHFRHPGEHRNMSYFSGLIDDVSIYNRALSKNEILTIYQSGAGVTTVSEPPAISWFIALMVLLFSFRSKGAKRDI